MKPILILLRNLLNSPQSSSQKPHNSICCCLLQERKRNVVPRYYVHVHFMNRKTPETRNMMSGWIYGWRRRRLPPKRTLINSLDWTIFSSFKPIYKAKKYRHFKKPTVEDSSKATEEIREAGPISRFDCDCGLTRIRRDYNFQSTSFGPFLASHAKLL